MSGKDITEKTLEAYREQLLKNDNKNRYPVITLVLYFGYKKHWKKPKTLLECLDVPEGLKPFVNDYKLNLFEMAYLTDEQVEKFKSDFRMVADYFVQMRKGGDYIPSKDAINHVHEFLQLMSAMTRDNRYEEVYNAGMEGRQTNMCEVLDRVENRGLEQGRQEGRTEGADSARTLYRYLVQNNRIEDIERVSTDRDYYEKLLKELSAKA